MLPDLIEISPLKNPVSAAITIPGSKSITNRALVLAALADGVTTLKGALWSEDTQVMAECLRMLGISVDVAVDPLESGNRILTVRGQGGLIPAPGTPAKPLDLFVGNAGTAARFLTAMACLSRGVVRLTGIPRMHERPQFGLMDALRQLGYKIETPNGNLPATIHGAGPLKGTCSVDITESSQFASALLLCAPVGGWDIQIRGEQGAKSPYVLMTQDLMDFFPSNGGSFQVEPDASGGSYFWAVNSLVNGGRKGVLVNHWPQSRQQIDARYPKYQPLPSSISRIHDLGDSIMTAMIEAPFEEHPVLFEDLARLRVQECERVHAMKTELAKCGAKVEEKGESLVIHPAKLHGAEIETYDDHRVAMCFAILGLRVRGVRLRHPSCVKKTFPNFFQKLASPPPNGLGAKILDANRRVLDASALVAS